MTILRSGLAATLLGLAVVLGGVAAPADASVDVAARQGAKPADTPAPQTSAPQISDRDDAHLLIVGAAGGLIGAGLAAGAWRTRRHPEAAAVGH